MWFSFWDWRRSLSLVCASNLPTWAGLALAITGLVREDRHRCSLGAQSKGAGECGAAENFVIPSIGLGSSLIPLYRRISDLGPIDSLPSLPLLSPDRFDRGCSSAKPGAPPWKELLDRNIASTKRAHWF
jgi:hypothetical protein